MKVAAIVVAAGQGSRMGAGLSKVFLPLAGVPMLVLTLRALLAAEQIAEVVVVVARDNVSGWLRLLDQWGPWRIAPKHAVGGAERQDSVAAGLAALADDTEIVAVHDGARPFVPVACVNAALAAAAAAGAAVVAVPSRDTVKLVDERGLVVETLARDRIWLAQTPQVFRADLLREAHARAAREGVTATDDAALVERLGRRVRIVPGDPANLKITTPEDLRWAEWYLRSRAPR